MAIAERPARRDVVGSAPDRLLAALGDLLTWRDTLEFSLIEVARRAGVNHALVGYHFGGKEGLLLALLERSAASALRSLEKLVAAELPGIDKIRLHIHGVLGVYHRHPYINRLVNTLQCGSDANARQLADIFILPLRRYQAALLEQASREGAIVAVDPSLFYYMLIGACDFLFQSRRTLPHVIGVDSISEEMKRAYADQLVRILSDGLRPR